MLDPTLAEALQMVAEHDAAKPVKLKEYRLYYREDGGIIGMWETDHPEGDNYVVIVDPNVFHKTNTDRLKVIEKKLYVIDPKLPHRSRLIRSTTGQPVVKGNAALALDTKTDYDKVEHYDRRTY